MVTSRVPPAFRRSAFATALPSSSTSPAAAISPARVRETPSIRERAVSTRSPTRPSGTGSSRASAIVFSGGLRLLGGRDRAGRVRPRPVRLETEYRERRDPDGGAHDRDVREVADEEARVVDEVHHVPAAEARIAEESVHQVAGRTAEQEPEHDRPPAGADRARNADHHHHD